MARDAADIRILPYGSPTAGNVPLVADLLEKELATNAADGRAWVRGGGVLGEVGKSDYAYPRWTQDRVNAGWWSVAGRGCTNSSGVRKILQANALYEFMGEVADTAGQAALTGMVYGHWSKITGGNAWYWDDAAWVDFGTAEPGVVPPNPDISPDIESGAWIRPHLDHAPYISNIPVEYVESYPNGKAGSGTYDDTAAYQWANDKLRSEFGGGIIKTRSAEYRLGAATLNVDSNIVLELGSSALRQDVADYGNMIETTYYATQLTVTAGQFTGTTGVPIPVGCVVRVANGNPAIPGTSWYARVVSVSGLNVIFDRACPVTLAAGTMFYSSMGIKILGGCIVGKDLTDTGATSFPMRMSLASEYELDTTIVGGNKGGLSIRRGTGYGKLRVRALNNSDPARQSGSAIWLFQGCESNEIVADVLGEQWLGVTIDDRTTVLDVWDGAVKNNKVHSGYINVTEGCDGGVHIHGEGNLVYGNNICGCKYGVTVNQTQQGGAQARPTSDNHVYGNTIKNALVGVNTQNVVTDTTIGINHYINCDEEINDAEGINTKIERLKQFTDYATSVEAKDTTSFQFSANQIADSSDGFIEFTVNTDVNGSVYVGVNDSTASSSAGSMNYGFGVLSSGIYQSRIGGAATVVGGAVTAGDVLRIERVGSDINWLINGAQVRTEPTVTTSAFYAHVRATTAGVKVDNVRVNDEPARWNTVYLTDPEMLVRIH